MSLLGAATAGLIARTYVPWRPDDPVLPLITAYRLMLSTALYVAYLPLLVATPYLACSFALSLLYIFVRHRVPTVRPTLPPHPDPATRADLFLVVGECHHPTRPVPVAFPTWLTIPDRGLCTGLAIIGAVGSGKTSGGTYPFAHQLLGYRRADPDRRIGGLILEVKGDFCHHVRAILRAHGREADYVDVGFDCPWRYNPLHNDLDAYGIAYGIASLLNNVFGKGKPSRTLMPATGSRSTRSPTSSGRARYAR